MPPAGYGVPVGTGRERPQILENHLPDRVVTAAIVAGAIGLAIVAHRLLSAVAGRGAHASGAGFPGRLLAKMKGPTALLLPLAAAMAALPVMGPDENVAVFARRTLTLVLTGCVGWLAVRLIGALFDSAMEHYRIDHADNLAA